MGGGGHLSEVSLKINRMSTVMGIDKHKKSFLLSNVKFFTRKRKNIKLFHDSFSNIEVIAKNQKIMTFKYLLCDLGISYNQIVDYKHYSSDRLFNKLDYKNFPKNLIITQAFKSSNSKYPPQYRSELDYKTSHRTKNRKKFIDTLKFGISRKCSVPFHSVLKGTIQTLRIDTCGEYRELKLILTSLKKILFRDAKIFLISFNSYEEKAIYRLSRNSFFIQRSSYILIKSLIFPLPVDIFVNFCSKNAKLNYLKMQELNV